jgi:curved DNA-binding protein
MNYYSTLGLKQGASNEDIKKAYRSMAMKHHPDRGGDERKFKEVEEAYRTLSDPQKKQMVDQGFDPNQAQGNSGFNQGPFEFHFGSGDINDIFNHFGFGFNRRQQRRNKSISINVEIDLEDVITGKEINAEIGISDNTKKVINIVIPAGIDTGQQIRYQGLGDNTIKDIRPGDLLVNVFVRPHPVFRRDGSTLFVEQSISTWDAILGTSIDITTLDRRNLNITVPVGTQPDTVFSCKGEGLPDGRTGLRGNLLIKIKVEIPRNLSEIQKQTIQKIKNGF